LPASFFVPVVNNCARNQVVLKLSATWLAV
jgi:hypothetical protein